MPEFIKKPTLFHAWLAVAVWVMAYGVLKAFSLDGLDIDSAEQVYFAQSWQMGYGTRQPPLYTWVLLLLKPESMSWVAALELARYACLVLWLAGVQALARVCGADRSVQARVVVAHLGLLLVMWRVHDSLTHTVLAAGVTVWASVFVIKALSAPRWWPVVGLLAAAACLSKLNAALWCVSSLVAAWLFILRAPHQDGPGLVASRGQQLVWMLVAAAVFAAAIAPYAHWWLTQPSGSVALARRIVVSDAQMPYWNPMLRVVLGSSEYLLLAPVLLTLLVWRKRGVLQADGVQCSMGGRWLVWQTLCGLTILIVVMTWMKASHFTPRWLWPVVPGVTVWMSVRAFAILDAAGPAGQAWRERANAIVWGLAFLAIGMVGVRLWVPQANAQRCVNCWTDRPAVPMSSALHQQYGSQALRIITGDDHLAGILVQANGQDSTWTAGSIDQPPPVDFVREHGPCVAAWVGMDQPRPMPPALQYLVGGAPVLTSSQASWPMRLAPRRSLWLSSVSLPASVCDKARQ